MERTIGLILGRSGCGAIGESEERGSPTARARENKIGGVRDEAEDHVAGVVANGSIGMSVQVVEELVAGLLCVCGW